MPEQPHISSPYKPLPEEAPLEVDPDLSRLILLLQQTLRRQTGASHLDNHLQPATQIELEAELIE